MRRNLFFVCAAVILQGLGLQNSAKACLARDPAAGQGAVCPIASTCKCGEASAGLHSQLVDAEAQAAAPTPVQIANFAFSPSGLTVQQGTTLQWTNFDSTTHTVTSDVQGVFDSRFLSRAQAFTFTFNTPGTFEYHCNIHSFMTGSVRVTAVPEPAKAGVFGLAAVMLGRRGRRGRDEPPAP